MPGNQCMNELDIARFDHRFEINAGEIATLLREVSLVVENVCDAPAHASSKIPAAGTEHDDQTVGHVFAAVIADAFNHSRRAGVADCKSFDGNASEKCFAAGGAVKHNVADQDIFFRG